MLLLLQRPKKRTADTDTDADEQERLILVEDDKHAIALYVYCT